MRELRFDSSLRSMMKFVLLRVGYIAALVMFWNVMWNVAGSIYFLVD
jgi:hypothetical protein